MKLIAGLGNPGPTYEKTRHNAGYRVCDILSERLGLEFSKTKFKAVYASGKFRGDTLILLKPLTFMNLSGFSVAAAVSFFRIAVPDLVVVHDDVDLPAGRIRLKLGGGAGGHKGVESVMENLGEEDFYRVRVGVGRPEDTRIDTSDFVLEKLSAGESKLFSEWCLEAADATLRLVEEGLLAAQNRHHGKA